MHYYIDGYNILFRVLRGAGDLKKQRDLFISELSEKIRFLNLEVTIVFDAHYQQGEGSRSLFETIEICYTDEGESADDYILKRLKSSKTPKQETVITSDNGLAWAARRYLAKTETVDEFLSWINKRYITRLIRDGHKEKKDQSKHLSKMEVISEEHSIEVIQPPCPGKNASDSFDYYLYQFEKEFRESQSNKVPKKEKSNKPPRPKKGIPKTENTNEPDMQRWQRLFEETQEADDPSFE